MRIVGYLIGKVRNDDVMRKIIIHTPSVPRPVWKSTMRRHEITVKIAHVE